MGGVGGRDVGRLERKGKGWGRLGEKKRKGKENREEVRKGGSEEISVRR